MMYIVYYKDDDNKGHMTFVKSFRDVRFIQERFEKVTFEMTTTYNAITPKYDINDEYDEW